MISLTLGLEPSTTQAPSTALQPPIKPPVMQKISVRALSTWNALVLGIVTGFAMSAGTLLFNKLAKRAGWQ